MPKTTSKGGVLEEIKCGRYRNQYLVYCRRSMDESESQKNSLAYQADEIAAFCARENLPVAEVTHKEFCTKGVIRESHSGFKESDELVIGKNGMVQMKIDRPNFQQLLLFVHQGYFKGIVCLCWDRLSRNKSDDAIVRKLIRRGVDVQFAYTSYDKSSSGELHMDIDGMFAAHHSRVTSEKIRAAQAKARRDGKWTNRAPIGYLNPGSMDFKPQDPDRAPFIAEMFRLYATGTWTLSDLVRHGNKAGFTSLPMRRKRTREEMLADEPVDIKKRERPLNIRRVHGILRNPFYAGLVPDDTGKLVRSTCHEAIVDKATFDVVQRALAKKQTSIHYTEKIDLPLRGVVRCGACNRVCTPYMQKGHFYFGAKCRPECTNRKRHYSFTDLDNLIRQALGQLYLDDEEAEKLDARTDTEVSMLEERRNRELQHKEASKKRIREELAYLRGNQVSLLRTGAYTPEDLVEERHRLEAELEELQTEEAISEEAMRALVCDVLKLSELLKNALLLYDLAKPREKECYVRLVFSELYVTENTLEYKLQPGFSALDRQKLLDCELSAWLSEIHRCGEQVQQARFALNKLITHVPAKPKNSP